MRLKKPATLVLSHEDLTQAIEYWMEAHMRCSGVDKFKVQRITLGPDSACVHFFHDSPEVPKTNA